MLRLAKESKAYECRIDIECGRIIALRRNESSNINGGVREPSVVVHLLLPGAETNGSLTNRLCDLCVRRRSPLSHSTLRLLLVQILNRNRRVRGKIGGIVSARVTQIRI